jgi:hypothetical protein
LHGSASLIRSHRSDSRGRLYGKQVQHFHPQATPAFDLLSLPFRLSRKRKNGPKQIDPHNLQNRVHRLVGWGVFYNRDLILLQLFYFFFLLSTLMDDKGVIL